ncbi:hypothetical protein MKC90_19100 [[Clostridium] innocuum]|nr:hypothetical protein [[Clostridium] innocuum]
MQQRGSKDEGHIAASLLYFTAEKRIASMKKGVDEFFALFSVLHDAASLFKYIWKRTGISLDLEYTPGAILKL